MKQINNTKYNTNTQMKEKAWVRSLEREQNLEQR